jgi:hypothetical protein
MKVEIRKAAERDFAAVQSINHGLFLQEHEKFDSTLKEACS